MLPEVHDGWTQRKGVQTLQSRQGSGGTACYVAARHKEGWHAKSSRTPPRTTSGRREPRASSSPTEWTRDGGALGQGLPDQLCQQANPSPAGGPNGGRR